jgi:TatD DNase family protein
MEPMLIVDTHAHLCDPVFDADRTEVLARARASGVCAIVAVAENLADAKRNLELAAAEPMVRPAAGLYPTVLDLAQAEEMEAFIRTHRSRLWAIGEVGLDYWAVKEEPQRELQRRILRRSIELANELDLPLNVHSRSAGHYAIDLLIEAGAKRVQMHAFDGRPAAALKGAEAGFFFSIPPSIVRSEQKQNLVRRLPLSQLLVETDSPVLGPTPHERNEPANASIAIREIARLKSLPLPEVAATLHTTTLRLYGVGPR